MVVGPTALQSQMSTNQTDGLDDKYKPYRHTQRELAFHGDLYHLNLSPHDLHHRETGTREH